MKTLLHIALVAALAPVLVPASAPAQAQTRANAKANKEESVPFFKSCLVIPPADASGVQLAATPKLLPTPDKRYLDEGGFIASDAQPHWLIANAQHLRPGANSQYQPVRLCRALDLRAFMSNSRKHTTILQWKAMTWGGGPTL